MLAVFFDHFRRGLKVSQIIKGVKDPEYINTHFTGLFHKGPNHVVGIVPIADQVLAAQKHGEGGLFDIFFEGAGTLPWVLI
jgi:hypothetical protein